jgi:hypothetical protein
MRKVSVALLLALFAIGSARPAFAVLQFYQQFDKVYLAEHANEEFVKAAHDPKMRCLICHQGKNRKNHNPYGEHLAKLLDRKTDLKDVDKIKESLAKVGAMHSDPKDESSPTYDDMIKAGKFPGGTLEEASKEPEKK